MGEGKVDLGRRQGIAWVTLQRPDKLNALAGRMREDLRDGIAEAARDPEVRALVVTGAGKAFCAGGDVEVMARLQRDRDEAGLRALLHAGAEVVLALQAFPGPTVAAVNGVAAGAGLSLALACDYRIAAAGARMGATWGRLGLVPDWGATYWLPRLLGPGRALELVLSGRLLGADEALRLGLVHEVVEAGELAERAGELARELGSRGREAAPRTRQLLRAGLESSLEAALALETEAQEERFRTAEVAEALEEFLGDRKAPSRDS